MDNKISKPLIIIISSPSGAGKTSICKKLLSLDYPLSDFYENFNYGDKKNITVRHLLTHSSGLPAYIEYYKNNEIKTKQDIINNITALDLEYKPDSKMVYSDLGMILLCDIIEKVSSSSLNNLPIGNSRSKS